MRPASSATLADGFYRQKRQKQMTPPHPSILFLRPEDAARAQQAAERAAQQASQQATQPAFFADLNLDQVTDAITMGRGEYDLRPFLHTPLREPESVRYRHDVLRDLDQAPTLTAVRAFAQRMRDMRAHLAQAGKLRERHQTGWWFLHAAGTYCGAVETLASDLGAAGLGAADLNEAGLASAGLRAFREYLAGYTRSEAFTALVAQTAAMHADLATVAYSVHIKGNRVRVSRYAGEPDYSTEVLKTFAKFKQGAVKDYRTGFRDGPEMNHVEAWILDLVARLHPRVFEALDGYYARHQDYLDPVIAGFDREVQFYLAYLEFMTPFTRAGLRFCYPQVSAEAKDSRAEDAFDLALAVKLGGRPTGKPGVKPGGKPRRPRPARPWSPTPWSPTVSPSVTRSGSWSSPARTRAARPPSPGCSASCTTWPAWGTRCRAAAPGCSCPTRSSPTSSGTRTWPPCAASWTTS